MVVVFGFHPVYRGLKTKGYGKINNLVINNVSKKHHFPHMPHTEKNLTYPEKIFVALKKQFPKAKCELQHETPLQLLIATILSAQCTDERVNIVTKSLFSKYPDATTFAEASLNDLENDIKSTGFYHNKAKSIKGCCQALLKDFDGLVPQDMEQLIKLPGVGRKTANVILGSAFGIASGIVVDTHVTRVSQRLGLTKEKIPEKIEKDLMNHFQQKQWLAVSNRLVHHGRYICTARKPKCNSCPMSEICPRIGVE
jgi:endonuclease III